MSKGRWCYGPACDCGTAEYQLHTRTYKTRSRCDCTTEESSRRREEQTRADLGFLAQKQAEYQRQAHHGKEMTG